MRVLVTRAEPAASKTAARLRDMGHQPLVMPLAMAVRDPAAAHAALATIPFAIAATSAEAMRTVEEVGATDPPWKQCTLFAVGEATADAARKAGFTDIVSIGADGRALADHIHMAASERDGPLLYLAGEPRSEGFEARMRELKENLHVTVCYRIVSIEPGDEMRRMILMENPPDAVLLYSAESARRLLALPDVAGIPVALKRMKFHCLSKKVADALPEPYRANTVIADASNESSLLGTL